MSFKAGGGPPGMREISLKIAALARGIAPNVSQARAFLRVWPVCLQQFFRGGKGCHGGFAAIVSRKGETSLQDVFVTAGLLINTSFCSIMG